MAMQSALNLTAPLNPLYPAAVLQRATDGVEYRRSRLGALERHIPDLIPLQARTCWKLEPYRGSEFESVANPVSRTRRRGILVDEGLVDTLRRLSGSDRQGLAIEIGDRFDPYPTAEQHFGLTRSVLEVLGEARGLDLTLTTRSPLVLRDRDLLGRLDLKHSVTVRVPISTLDPRLAARMEPNAPNPASRLDMVRCLAQDGIAAVIFCGPILPGINNSADELDPLFAAARRAGAIDVVGNGRLLKPKNRPRVAKWLKTHFLEDRAATILRLLNQGTPAGHLGTLERLRLSYGFPILRAGRG